MIHATEEARTIEYMLHQGGNLLMLRTEKTGQKVQAWTPENHYLVQLPVSLLRATMPRAAGQSTTCMHLAGSMLEPYQTLPCF
jgi:hypothetical protein